MNIQIQKQKDCNDNIDKKRGNKGKRILLVIVICIAVVICVGLIRTLPLYVYYKGEAYKVLTTMDEGTFYRSGKTLIYDKDDELIGQLGIDNYEYVGITSISNYVTDGYIAREDRKFPVHRGVDPVSTLKAFFTLLKNKGEITIGGSTITQQVVKNNLLSQEKTYERKILEIFLAFQLEKRFDKARIMEFYCNSNYYGNNCYGIQSASQYYFKKDANQLTLAQAAMLVATSNSPNRYNPVANYELCLQKKQLVLESMLSEGYISQEEYDAAEQEQPEVFQNTQKADHESYEITYAIHCAAQALMEREGFVFSYLFDSEEAYEAYEEQYEETYNEKVNTIRTGGYHIYTSIDPAIQNALQEQIDAGLEEFTDKAEDGRYQMQGAAVCIDNQSRMVVAIVGGRGTEDSFNRGYQAYRQPGSAIKPLLVYGPALEEGVVTPATVYNDKEITIDGYTPQNAGGGHRGKMTIREALARSVNTIAVQVYEETGKENSLSYLEKLQFDTMTYADSIALSASIGGFTKGVSVDDMARGYAAIANMGRYSENTCIRSLTDNTQEEIYEAQGETLEVYSEDTAFMLADMMQGVFRESYGTANKYENDAQIYAGKTGTTNDNRDAWFGGFSAYYTTVVWVGCDQPQSVKGLSGNTYPAAIWSAFMDEMHEGLEKKDFPIADTIMLSNANGTRQNITYDTDVYVSRPAGWDYVSSLLEEKKRRYEQERQNQEYLEFAEQVVAEFEEYRITSAEEAVALAETYNTVLTTIDKVASDEDRDRLARRAASKYDSLSENVVQAWADAAQKVSENERQIKDMQNIENAQRSLEDAQNAYKTSCINTAQWYITKLNERSIYSAYTQQLIDYGRQAVDNCTEFEEYALLNEAYMKAVQYAMSLPTQIEEQTSVPSVDEGVKSGTTSETDNQPNDFVNIEE